jgi:hypothetical protein
MNVIDKIDLQIHDSQFRAIVENIQDLLYTLNTTDMGVTVFEDKTGFQNVIRYQTITHNTPHTWSTFVVAGKRLLRVSLLRIVTERAKPDF